MYLIEIRSTTTQQKEIDVAYPMHEATVMGFSMVVPARPESIKNGSFSFAIFMGPRLMGKGTVIEKSLLLTNSSSPRGSLRPLRLSFSLSSPHAVAHLGERGISRLAWYLGVKVIDLDHPFRRLAVGLVGEEFDERMYVRRFDGDVDAAHEWHFESEPYQGPGRGQHRPGAWRRACHWKPRCPRVPGPPWDVLTECTVSCDKA